jgi:hypothetical protein
MRPQVELEPDMLRNVIEKGRCRIAYHEHDRHGDKP